MQYEMEGSEEFFEDAQRVTSDSDANLCASTKHLPSMLTLPLFKSPELSHDDMNSTESPIFPSDTSLLETSLNDSPIYPSEELESCDSNGSLIPVVSSDV